MCVTITAVITLIQIITITITEQIILIMLTGITITIIITDTITDTECTTIRIEITDITDSRLYTEMLLTGKV